MTNQLMAVVQLCNQQNFGSQWPQNTVVNGKKENWAETKLVIEPAVPKKHPRIQPVSHIEDLI